MLCTGFNGVELGPEDVSLLERCPLLLGTKLHITKASGIRDFAILYTCIVLQSSTEVGR